MTQLTDLDYESIENAVMETARGRWFLTEYKKRNGQDSTPDLMDAIKRLEKIAISIGNDIVPQEKSEAKPQIIQPAPALVATMESQPEPQPESQQESQQESEPETAANPPLSNAPLNDENLQFFANDEDLFADDANALLTDKAPDTHTEKGSVSFKSVPKQVAEPESERFKVFKMENNTAENSAPPTESAPEAEAAPKEEPAIDVPDPVMNATKEEKDRIVVIRSSDKNDIDIPLAADFAQELDNLSAKKF